MERAFINTFHFRLDPTPHPSLVSVFSFFCQFFIMQMFPPSSALQPHRVLSSGRVQIFQILIVHSDESWLSLDFRISNITDDCDAAITAPGEDPNNDKHFALYAANPALGRALNIQHRRQLYILYRLHRDVFPDCYLVILHCHAEYHWNKIHRFTPHKINVRVRIHPSPIRDLCAFNLIPSINRI